MAEKPETRFWRRCRDYARSRGVFIEKVHGHVGQRRGLPDSMCCYESIFFLIEFKMPGEALRKDQEQVIAEIEAAGGVVPVIDQMEQLVALLDHIKRTGRLQWPV